MWEPKTYDASRFDDIIEMSIENYGKENDICNPAFLKHQYFDNPAGDALIELAVDPENGELAGSMWFSRLKSERLEKMKNVLFL